MLRQRIHNSYSVFVGHLHPDITRREISDIFKVCGEIIEVVILDSQSSYNYGFVRYVEEESAFKAIRELNHWPLNGVELVVDISKDTANRLKREREEKSKQKGIPNETAVGRRDRQNGGPSNASMFLQDTMYLNRLKENCVALHRKGSDGTGIVGADFFLDDIGEAQPSRFPSLWGTLGEPAVSFNNISQKIMQRCKKSAEVDSSFGERKAAEFMSSLEIIMKEIGDVIGAKIEQKSRRENAGEQTDNISEDDLAIKQCLDNIRSETKDDEETLRNESNKMSEVISKDKISVARHRVYKNVDNLDWCSDDEKEEELNDKIGADLSEYSVEQDLDTSISDSLCSSKPSGASEEDTTINASKVEYSGLENSEIDHSNINSYHNDNRIRMSERDTYLSQSEVLDPAILDYHLSKLSEKDHFIETKQEKPHNILDELFENISIRRQSSDQQMARSLSQDSSMSSGSNDGNVDDSGVESDFHMVRNSQRGLPEMGTGYGSDRVRGKRSHPDMADTRAASVRQDKTVGIQDYVMKNLARGRAMNLLTDQNIKLPVGRGMLSWK